MLSRFTDLYHGTHGGKFDAFAEILKNIFLSFYFRNERENALLSVIEETRHDTFESAERQHWDAVSSEWEADKMRILTALSGANASEAATESFLPRKEQTRIHETTLGNLCMNSENLPHLIFW